MLNDSRINPGEFTTTALAYSGKEFWVDDAGRPVANNDAVGAQTICGKFEPIDSVYAEDGARMGNLTARFTTYASGIYGIGQQLQITGSAYQGLVVVGVYEIIDMTPVGMQSLYVELTLRQIKTFGLGLHESPTPEPDPDDEEEAEPEED